MEGKQERVGRRKGNKKTNQPISKTNQHIPDNAEPTSQKQYKDVNSFSKYGSNEASFELIKIASSSDGIIMAIEHQHKDIYGVMWHMERGLPFCKIDQALFKSIFS